MVIPSERLDDLAGVDTWNDRKLLGLYSELRWQWKRLQEGVSTQSMRHEGHRPDIVEDDTGTIYQVKNCQNYKALPGWGLLCEEHSYSECLRREEAGEDVWMVFDTPFGWRKQRPSELAILREPTAYERGSPTLAYTFVFESTEEC